MFPILIGKLIGKLNPFPGSTDPGTITKYEGLEDLGCWRDESPNRAFSDILLEWKKVNIGVLKCKRTVLDEDKGFYTALY